MNREQILKNNILPIKAVKAFGGTVHVKTLSGRELTELQKWLADAENRELTSFQVQAGLLVRTMCDRSGRLLFDDAGQLDDLNPREVARVFRVSEGLNTVSHKDLEGAEKN